MTEGNGKFAEVRNKYGGTCKVVIGGAWGDEGKGKIASKFAENADLVIRGNGGANAGHSVNHDDIDIGLHLVPTGILYPQTTCLMGQGMVMDPKLLIEEIEVLQNAGVPDIRKRLKIAYNIHIVFPYHKYADKLYEEFKENPVGTTGRGIGPAYADKDYRSGLRLMDLLLPKEEVRSLLETAVKPHNQLFIANGKYDWVVDIEELLDEYIGYAKQLEPMMEKYPAKLVYSYYKAGKNLDIEAAQADRLDHNDPDYPNNTSSGCTFSALLEGAHVTPSMVTEVVIITKAHFSRVGNGPFITELPAHIENDKVVPYGDRPYYGDVMRETAHEYGVSTGRPRRVGWYDAVIESDTAEKNDADYLCINHIDTLGELGKQFGAVKVCVKYNYQGKEITTYPTDMRLTKEIPIPIYEEIVGGWEISSDIRDYDSLPQKAKEFIELIENVVGIPVKYIGVGAHNDDLIIRA